LVRWLAEEGLTVIESQEEFEQCVSGKVPDEKVIDFDRHTLLLVTVSTVRNGKGIITVSTSLERISPTGYVLHATVYPSRRDTVVNWDKGFLVAKLPAGFSVDYQLEVFPLADLDTVTACGVLRPHENLPWLAEWIATAERGLAENDRNLLFSHSGTIRHTIWKGQELFITNMRLHSGHSFKTFDCEGNFLGYSTVDNDDEMTELYFSPNMLEWTVIYSNEIGGW
jgi:hypothetical protein